MWNFGNLVLTDGWYTDRFGNQSRFGTKKIEESLFAAYVENRPVTIKFKDGTIRHGKIDCPYSLSINCARTFKGGIYWFEATPDKFFGSEVEVIS